MLASSSSTTKIPSAINNSLNGLSRRGSGDTAEIGSRSCCYRAKEVTRCNAQGVKDLLSYDYTPII